MLVPMAKIELIGPKNLFFDVVSLLHERGTLHIEDLTRKIQSGELPLDRMEVYAEEQEERERMEDMLIRVRAILKALQSPTAGVESEQRQAEYQRLWALHSKELAAEIASVIAEVEDKTSGLASTRTSVEAELALLGRYEPILQKIQPLARQIVTTGAFESVALLFERRYKAALEQLREELDRITHKQCEIVATDVDEDTTAAIVVFSKTYSDAVHKFLAMENVNQIRLPDDFSEMPFDVAYDAIKDRRKHLPETLGAVREELDQMSAKWYLRLSTIRDVLIDKIDEIAAIPKFGRTEYAFVITGWMPVEDVAGFRKVLASKFKDEVILTQTEIDEHEFAETPVAIKNPKILSPFQSLLGVYGIPKYGTVDPTWMLFIFYPLFFGMIVGDIGYGLIMLAIVLWLRFSKRDNAGVQLATAVLGPAATMVVAFGFLYQEAFGDLLSRYLGFGKYTVNIGPLELPFHRVYMVETFMIIALAVGVVHVGLGLVVGVINGMRTKHIKHVWERGGMLGVLVAVIMFGLTALKIVAETLGPIALVLQAVAALLFVFGFVYAFRGGSVMGAIESILQFSQIASYIRIMAVGLAGAIFADAVNGIIASMGNIGLGILVGLLLHGLNFVIASFSPTIHALRLNFLEFFGKFYEAGKQQYSPFQKTGGEKGA